MKMNNIFKGISFAMVALAALTTTSCKDEPDAYKIADGTPVVNYIRPVDASAKDSLLTSAALRSTICIVGQNLRSVTALYFNDQKAVLNTSYMTDNTLIVTVPNEIPEKISDKIFLCTNSKDTVEYAFRVEIPSPVVSSMSNEWAAAGEEVTINGDYFLDYENAPLTVKFGENYELDRSYITKITKTGVTFTMPADAPQGEKISVASTYGTTEASFQYMDKRNMLFDFDTPNPVTNVVLGNNGWHARTIMTDGTSLSGNFMILGETTMSKEGAWNDGNFSFEYWAGDWGNPETFSGHPRLFDVVDFTDFENMSLKFEVNIPEANAWSAAPIQIFFGGTDKVSNGAAGAKDSYGNVLAGCNNVYFHEQGKLPRALYMPWKDSDDLLYHTSGKWMTVTIPFSDFIYDYDGNKLSSGYSSALDFANFCMFVIKGGYNDKTVLPDGVDCNPIIKIDNIRVIPNK